MVKLWRFLRYGPTALKILQSQVKVLKDDLGTAKQDLRLQATAIESLQKQIDAIRGTPFQSEQPLTDEQLSELRRRRFPGLTKELESQIDWERV